MTILSFWGPSAYFQRLLLLNFQGSFPFERKTTGCYHPNFTSETSINHSISCDLNEKHQPFPTFCHHKPNKPPPTCGSGVPQQPQHLSFGKISSSGMAWSSTTLPKNEHLQPKIRGYKRVTPLKYGHFWYLYVKVLRCTLPKPNIWKPKKIW